MLGAWTGGFASKLNKKEVFHTVTLLWRDNEGKEHWIRLNGKDAVLAFLNKNGLATEDVLIFTREANNHAYTGDQYVDMYEPTRGMPYRQANNH